MNFNAIAEATAQKIRAAGLSAILMRRTVSTYDPATSAEVITWVSYNGYYLETGYSTHDKDGSRLEEPTIRAMIAGFDVRATPGDKLLVAGATLIVLASSMVSPNGIIIYQDVEVRL